MVEQNRAPNRRPDLPENRQWLTEEEINDLVTKSVRATLLQIGVVVSNDSDMRETQRDFAYLRDLRMGSSAMKNKGILAIIGIVVTALATLIWVGLNTMVHTGSGSFPGHG